VAGLATICCDLRSHGWLAAAAMIETLAGERDTDTKNLTIHKLVKEIAEYRADAERLHAIEHAAWHVCESSEDRVQQDEIVVDRADFEALSALLPEEHPAARGASTKEVDRG